MSIISQISDVAREPLVIVLVIINSHNNADDIIFRSFRRNERIYLNLRLYSDHSILFKNAKC